jgi:hypothetical protein
MDGADARESRATGRLAAWVTAVLLTSAAGAVAALLVVAAGPEDVDPSESPLILSVARQLVAGPWSLYGPFGGRNPLVLIHAPLYYRLAALATWPMTRAGLSPTTSALASGRSLSFLAFLATLWGLDRLACVGGAHRRAGVWSAALFASAPLLGGLPVAVRPDMLAVALQVAGVTLVLEALTSPRPLGGRVVAAYGLFGLSLCVKQHMMAAPLLSTVFLLRASRLRKPPSRVLGKGCLLAMAVVLLVYGAEEIVTGGQMSRAVFLAASNVPKVHPAGWDFLGIVLVGVAHWSYGLLTLLAAAGVAAAGSRPGWGRRTLVAAGTGLITLIAAVSAWHVAVPLKSYIYAVLIAEQLVLALLLAPSILIAARLVLGGRVDAALWVYLAGETAVMTALGLSSTGAWFNYAMLATAIACVLTGRAMSRAFDAAGPRALVPVAVAVLILPAVAAAHVFEQNSLRTMDRLATQALLNHHQAGPGEVFFAARPGDNRVQGRPELVFDDWLYPVFERSGQAEPLASWLVPVVAAGPVRVIILRSESTTLPGTTIGFRRLGYVPDSQAGPFYSWRRLRNRPGESR